MRRLSPLFPSFIVLFSACLLAVQGVLAASVFVGNIDPSAGPECDGPLKVYDPVTDRLFGIGVNSLNDKLSIMALDPATNRIVQSRSLGIVTFFHAPVLDSAGGRLFVLENNSNKRLHILSTADLHTIAAFDLQRSPEKLAINPNTNKAYVISYDDYLTEVDLATGALRTVTSFSNTGGMALNRATNKLYVWDTNFQFEGIRVVNAASTDAYLASIPLSGYNFGVAPVPSGDGSKVYLLGAHDNGNYNDEQNRYTGRILTLDATTDALVGQPMIVDKAINDFAYDPQGNAMYTTARYYIQPDVFHRASKTNLATGETTLLGELPLVNNSARVAFASSNQTLYLHLEDAHQVPQIITINPNTLARGGFNYAFEPWGVAVDAQRDRVYFTHNNVGEVTVADGTTRQVLAHISLGGVSSRNSFAQSIAVNSNTARAYASSYTEEQNPVYKNDVGVSVIDTLTNQVLTRIILEGSAPGATVTLGNVGLLADETTGRVYASYSGYDSVNHIAGVPRLAVIDGKRGSPTENQILGVVDLRYSADGMALNPVTKRLYLVHHNANIDDISVYDTTKLGTGASASLGSFDTGGGRPACMAINPVTNRLYVPDSDGLQVRVFNGANNAFITSITVKTPQNTYGSGIFAAAVDSTTNRIYIPDSSYTPSIPGTLNVIDGATNQITTLGLEIGALPFHLAVNEKTHTVYIAKERGTDVAVVNDAPPPVITTSAFPFKGGPLKVTGANGSYTFNVVTSGGGLGNSLATGQILSPSGVVSGIAEPGTYTITIRVTEDANPARFAEKTFTFTVPGKPNPLTISVDQRDGSELKQGGIVKLQWTITNSSTTEKAPNVQFKIDPPPGFALQDFGETPIFVDPTSGQATGAPIDPVTKKQVTIPGSRFNPELRRTSFGYPAVTFGLGTMLPGQVLKVRANFRIAYDWPVGADLPFNHAIASVGTKVGQYVDEQMPLETISVAAADPGDTRPELTVDMTQAGAAWDLDRPAVATISRIGVAIAGAAPTRKTNEILYRATYRNLGARTARSLQLRIPIPRHTSLKPGSASVDGVKLKDPDVERQYDSDGKLDQEVLIFPTLPDLAPYPADGNARTVSFLVRLKGVTQADELSLELMQEGVLLYTPELLRLYYVAKPLLAKLVRPANMVATRPSASGPLDFGPYADPNKPTLTSVQFRYLNAGGLAATGVTAKFIVPPGAKYVDSFVLSNKGTVLGASERELATLRTQNPKQAAKYKRIEFDGAAQVNFNIGTVAPNAFGYVRVLLQADPATRASAGAGADANRSLARFTASDTKGQFLPAPPTAGTLRARGPVARANAADAGATGDLNLRHQGGDLGSVFVVISAPAFATSGSEVTYRVTWGNLSNTATQPGSMQIPIPAGTEYVAGSIMAPQLFANTAGPGENEMVVTRDPASLKATRIAWSQNPLAPHSLKTGTFTLKITAEAGSAIRLTGAQMIASNASSCLNTPHVLQVIGSTSVSLDDRRTLFANQYGPGAYAAFGSSKRPSNGFINGVSTIDFSQVSVRVANAEFLHYPAEGVVLIPLGGLNRVFAIGGDNLSTMGAFTGLSAGSGNHKLLAGDGATIRVAIDGSGGAFFTGATSITNLPENLKDGFVNVAPSPFCHNLVGNDGASLVGQDGSTLVGQDGSTLVGLNGATLVGQDGSTLVARFFFDGKTNFIQRLDSNGQLTGSPIELVRAASQLVAAGGGNIITAGGGKVLAAGPRGNLIGLNGTPLVGQDSGTLTFLDGSTVIARDGASVIARDGAGLVGQDGSTVKPITKGQNLVGQDGSTVIARDGASLVGQDGSTMSFLGKGQDVSAGAGLVTDNGAGIVGDNGGG